MEKRELLAVLHAYQEAISVASPTLHPEMVGASKRWLTATATDLASEFESYLRHASDPSCSIRIFCKTGNDLVYVACNRQFAKDAGLTSAREMIGLTDFDPRISWVAQAAKYRRDDRDVIQTGTPMLGIIERQSGAEGTIWLDTSKVPVLVGGRAIGIFGTYEIIDAKLAARRNLDRKGKPLDDVRDPREMDHKPHAPADEP